MCIDYRRLNKVKRKNILFCLLTTCLIDLVKEGHDKVRFEIRLLPSHNCWKGTNLELGVQYGSINFNPCSNFLFPQTFLQYKITFCLNYVCTTLSIRN